MLWVARWNPQRGAKRMTSPVSNGKPLGSAKASGRSAKWWLLAFRRRQFSPLNAHVWRSLDSEAHAVSTYEHDGDSNLTVDDDFLARFASQHEHSTNPPCDSAFRDVARFTPRIKHEDHRLRIVVVSMKKRTLTLQK
jgi:hypothetical protein